MRNNNLFKTLLLFVGFLFFVSCDKDYNEIGDALIGENHFDLTKDDFSVLAYNQKINPIQSNNLPVNALGIYNNTAFGKTTANFVTELALTALSPVIGANAEVESVYLEIPYFVDATKTTAITTGGYTYELDSIYGASKAKIKLSVFESGTYTGAQTGVDQLFYTNDNSLFDGKKIGNRLNDFVSTDKEQNDAFFFDPAQHIATTTTDGKETKTYTAPGMRLELNKQFFKDKILKAPAKDMASNEAFKRYFNGLYFKVEQSGSDAGSLAMMNFAKGTITINYKEDTSLTDATKIEKTIVINLTGNTVSLLEETNPNTAYTTAINAPDKVLGDEKLYLKGGEGAMAVVKLFGSTDTYGYELLVDANKKPIDENGNIIPLESNEKPKAGYYFTYIKKNSSNGISDELDDIRFPKIDDSLGQIYHSIKRRRLINQASLIFTIDATTMANSSEPERLYLYDFTNNTTILDYYIAATSTNKNTSRYSFGGYLKRETTAPKRGVSYKINVTSHVRNLVQNTEAKNIELGLVVTEDINIADFYKLKTPTGLFIEAPKASVMNPLGTILHGSNSTDANKKLKLEIYYTKPN